MQHRRLPVRDELYLLAHHDNGHPRIHVPALSLALAGATIIDQVTAGRVTAARETGSDIELLAYRSLQPTGDPIADSVLDGMRDHSGRKTLRGWIKNLSPGVYERTGSWLHVSGIVAQQRKRRLLGEDVVRYPALRIDYVRWLHSLLYQAANINPQLDLQSAALCRFVALLGLEALSGANLPTTDLLWRLGQPLEISHQPETPAVVIVTSTVEMLIGELAVAVYR